MTPPHLNINDFIIVSPSKAAQFNDIDLSPDRFHLISVLADKGETFDYEILLDGPCALVEAIAISACKKGQRVWFPNEPFGANP